MSSVKECPNLLLYIRIAPALVIISSAIIALGNEVYTSTDKTQQAAAKTKPLATLSTKITLDHSDHFDHSNHPDFRILPPANQGEQPVLISTETKHVTVQRGDTVYKILRQLGFTDPELSEAHREVQRLNPNLNTSMIHQDNLIECPLPFQG